MGISGVYGEIGPGRRIALTKLAIEKFEEARRPLRIAIDISIWQFQTQFGGQGGTNPAIRTLYFRLQRLLSLSIQPIFIFDGPNKPTFKRGKKSGHQGATVSNLMTTQLLKLFGFPYHMAPGEAEAECALLQREGIVDAVLSEDVDTLMFGCGLTLRNWSSEGPKGSKSPTHVSAYCSKATKEGKSGLDREGMILVALMSGGDYNTAGIPGCGIKLACQAARAGFGTRLCRLARSDTIGLDAWRKELEHEIQTNESKHFRTKKPSQIIPENFPDKETLSYYTHPVVSSASKIEKLKTEIVWDGEIDVQGLRLFVAERFDWSYKSGAVKFIRGLAPALLVHKLRVRADRRDSGYGDVLLTSMNEMHLVRSICGKRNHFSTDAMPELRVTYVPIDIVGLNLDEEQDESDDYGRDGLAPVNDDDQIEAYVSDDAVLSPQNIVKKATYDPTKIAKEWIPETIAKVGIPLKVQDYEESLRENEIPKAKHATKMASSKKPPVNKKRMPKGALDKFVKVLKPGRAADNAVAFNAVSKVLSDGESHLLPVVLAPALAGLGSSENPVAKPSKQRAGRTYGGSSNGGLIDKSAITKPRPKGRVAVTKPRPNANPWTLAHPVSHPQPTPGVTKSSIQQQKPSTPPPHDDFYLSLGGSPTPSPAPNTGGPSRKHQHSPTSCYDAHEAGLDLPASVRISRGSKQGIGSETLSRAAISPSKLSSRKKISAGRPKTRDMESFLSRRSLSAESVRRKVDCGREDDSRDRSSRPELPNQVDVYFRSTESRTPEKALAQKIISLDSSPIQPPPPPSAQPSKPPLKPTEYSDKVIGKAEKKGPNKFIMLRESLPGGWKEISEDEVEKRKGMGGDYSKGKAWRYSQVGVLDLSED